MRRSEARPGLGLVLAGLLVLAAGCEETTSTNVVSEDLIRLEADNLVLGMEHEMTQSGVRYAQLHADTAYYFQNEGKYELHQLSLVVYTTTGVERATMTSEWGELMEANESMIARRNVVLILPDRDGRLETSELHYDPVNERFWSDSATVFTEGTRVTRGTGFESDLSFQNVSVTGASIRGRSPLRF